MKRYKHNLTNYKLTTADLGQVVPVGLTEVLPGDTIRQATNLLVRVTPLAAPLMHPVRVRLHHFYVPSRLIWEDAGGTGTFEDFMTGGADGNDTQTVPTIASTATAKDLQDYFWIPREAGVNINALPFAAYNRVWNEYFRDQDLMTERAWNDLTVARCAWGKDYFTISRPWTQKGSDVTLPLGTRAPVKGIGASTQSYTAGGGNFYQTDGTGTDTYAASKLTSGFEVEQDPNNTGFPNIYADLTGATAASVIAIREAFALQRYKEARAMMGSRYTEYLRYLGVRSSDSRLDRPEYLGGSTQAVSFSEVLQTAPEATGREFGVGDMYGHGVSALRGNAYRRFFEEHGYVMSLMSVIPTGMYTNGLDRMWLRQDKEDFWQKELELIGQQAISVNEVFMNSATGSDTFGYTDRYAEYRFNPNQVSAEMRSTLNYWHLGRIFASAPALNSTFVTCEPSKRVFNEQTQNSLWVMAHNRMAARRLVRPPSMPRIL